MFYFQFHRQIGRMLFASLLIYGCSAFAEAGVEKDPPANRLAKKSAEDQGTSIAKLIEQLGHSRYVLREQAQEDLRRIGAPALDALSEATEHEDIEVAMRAKYLLSKIKIEWARDSDPPPIRELMKNYGSLKSEADRRRTIDTLAGTGGPTEVEVLCRIVRYEPSHKLSKLAALAVMNLDPLSGDEFGKRAARVDKVLGSSSRAGASWLRQFFEHQRDADAVLAQWSRWIEEEKKLLATSPRFTSREIILSLLKQNVDLLQAAGRKEEAERILAESVDYGSGDPESVGNLIRWLASKKAWSVIDGIEKRFPRSFENDSVLMFILAEARLVQGKKELADEVVARAEKRTKKASLDILRLGNALQNEGLFHWAERQYGRVIALEGSLSVLDIKARRNWSEMLHDMGDDGKAADALEPIVKALPTQPTLAKRILKAGYNPGSFQSRMYYFRAVAAEAEGKFDEQAKLLETAVAKDPTDGDVLIALYRLPKQSDAKQKKNLSRIQSALRDYRGKISPAPDSYIVSIHYNHFAWLVGNTIGEKDAALCDEAINMSNKSLELFAAQMRRLRQLSREDIPVQSAAFLDTLARTYYAKKDYDSAVRYQRQAARMEPHSGLIRRQLELFEKAVAKEQK